MGLLLCTTLRTAACDYCGIFLNVQPHDRSSQISLFWRARTLHGTFAPVLSSAQKHGGTTPTSTPTEVTELYQTLELRGDLRLSDRWFATGSLPLVNNYRGVNGYRTADIYAMGDPLFLARYQVVNTKCLSDSVRTVHRLLLGGGAKLPLGRTDMTYHGEQLDHDLQPGTGTWDALVSAEYTVRRDRWGMAVNTIARINGTNNEGFHPGNGLNLSAEVFRRWDVGAASLMPSVGGYAEAARLDSESGLDMEGTGGSVLFAHLGSRVWWNDLMVTAAYQRALVNDLGAMMVPNRDRVILGITYIFNNN